MPASFDGQLRHHIGTRVECAIADDLAHAIVEIDARCERQIDPVRAQLCRHEPAHAACERQTLFGVLVEGMTDATRCAR
jgi:hypothetical protein